MKRAALFRPLQLFRAAVAAGLIPPAANSRKQRRRAVTEWNHYFDEPNKHENDSARIAALVVASAVRGRAGGVQSLAANLATLPAFLALNETPAPSFE